jgi:hypothetical protein
MQMETRHDKPHRGETSQYKTDIFNTISDLLPYKDETINIICNSGR